MMQIVKGCMTVCADSFGMTCKCVPTEKRKKHDSDSVSFCGNSRRRIRPAMPVVSPGGALGSRLKPTSTALKVMRVNSRLGDSYGSLAPGLCGRKASRDVSAQDLPPDPDGDR